MKATHWWIVLAVAGSLAACGDGQRGKPGLGSNGGPGSRPAAGKGNKSAEEVAEEARGKVRCPAKISSPDRASGAPVDDIVGVRPGITFDEAANVVLCTSDLMVVQTDTSQRFNIQTYGQNVRQGFSARFAEPYVVKDSRQYMKEMSDEFMARSGNAVRRDMKPGQSKWYVGTMGLPGQERVINAAREEWYEEGRNPPMDGVEQALIKKYGTPTRVQKNATRYMTWAYDPAGRPLNDNRCAGTADPDGGTSFLPDCGVVITAMIHPLQSNPDLSQSLQLGIVDQAGGYTLITGTEEGLKQADAQRRAKEVQAASKNADAPQL